VNAIEELGEVVKTVDKGERVIAFAHWVARWVEQGHVRSDVDVEEAQDSGDAARYRFCDDAIAVGALLEDLARERRADVYEVEDLGIVELPNGQKAYRTMMRLTILLAKPHELAPATPGAGGRS
jgi:hypothetical protein